MYLFSLEDTGLNICAVHCFSDFYFISCLGAGTIEVTTVSVKRFRGDRGNNEYDEHLWIHAA